MYRKAKTIDGVVTFMWDTLKIRKNNNKRGVCGFSPSRDSGHYLGDLSFCVLFLTVGINKSNKLIITPYIHISL